MDNLERAFGVKFHGTRALQEQPEGELGFEAHEKKIFHRWYCDHEEVRSQCLSQVAIARNEEIAQKIAKALNQAYPKGEDFDG